MIKQLANRLNLEENIVRSHIAAIVLRKKIAEIEAVCESKSIEELELLTKPKVDTVLGFVSDAEILIEKKSKNKAKFNANMT